MLIDPGTSLMLLKITLANRLNLFTTKAMTTKFKVNDRVIVADPDRLEHLQEGVVIVIDHQYEEIIVEFSDGHVAGFVGDAAGEDDIILKQATSTYKEVFGEDSPLDKEDDDPNYSASEAGRAGKFLGLGHDYVPGDPGL